MKGLAKNGPRAGAQQFDTFAAATTPLQAWERTDNVERFSLALHVRTPADELGHLLPAAALP